MSFSTSSACVASIFILSVFASACGDDAASASGGGDSTSGGTESTGTPSSSSGSGAAGAGGDATGAGGAGGSPPPPDCVPNRFVTPTAPGGGDGSTASPWTLEEAMALAVAGDSVQVAPGTYLGTATGDRYLPTYRPANSGTEEAPIVFCAEFPAALYEEAPESWSVIQNDGPAPGDNACSPAYGVASASHIVWDGFAVDQADAPWRPDTAPITLYQASHVRIVRNRVVARERPFYDNNNGIRVDFSDHTVISDNRIICVLEDDDAANDPGGIQSYDSGYYEWAHNEITGCATGFHPKGVHEGSTFYLLPGAIHHNLVTAASDAGFYIQAVPGFAESSVQPDEYLDIYQNVVTDSSHAIILNPPGDGACRRLRFVNNTFAALDPVHGAGLALIWVPGPESFGLSTVHNNIFQGMAGPYGFQGGDEATLLGALDRLDYDHNAFFDVGATVIVTDHVVFASVIEALSEWQARGHDPNSSAFDPLLVDYAARDLRLQDASPARGAGVDVLGLKGLGTDTPIHLGAYITDDQSDVIGIR